MDMQNKYLAVFFYGVSLYTGEEVVVGDDDFNQLLLGFMSNYYGSKHEIMDKVFGIKKVPEKGYTYSIDYDKVLKYGLLLRTNPKKFCEMYDEVGQETIDEITELSYSFCKYVEIIEDMNNSKRIRH